MFADLIDLDKGFLLPFNLYILSFTSQPSSSFGFVFSTLFGVFITGFSGFDS